MLANIGIGCVLLILTTFVHAAAMIGAFQALKLTHAECWFAKSHSTKATVVSALVLVMFLASVVEIGAWAATYLIIGAVSGFEKALYFSGVTYTTLGYGDVVIGEQWRLLSAFEAANGIIMFGWTTALIFAAVHAVFLARGPSDDQKE